MNPKHDHHIQESFGEQASKGVSTIAIVFVVIVIIIVASAGYYFVSTLGKTTSGTGTSISSTTSLPQGNPLIFFSADAYVNESTVLEKGFTAQSGIEMATPVSAGSSTLAANIAAGDPVSVFLSVSRTAVEGKALGSQFPGWAVAFAADQMGIAYTNASTTTSAAKAVLTAYDTAASTNTTASWYDFFSNITSGQVKVGISNPNDDPAGYRAWLVLQLAGITYGGVSNEAYFVNRMLTNQGNVTGASAAALVPALDTGQINFLFIYKSVISSEGLRLVQLGDPVNLGSPSNNSYYSQANYSTSGGLEKGSAITLWLTVPKDTTDATDAVNFVVYTIQNYHSVLKNFGLVSLIPAQLYNTTGYTVPSPLVSLLNNGTLTGKGPV